MSHPEHRTWKKEYLIRQFKFRKSQGPYLSPNKETNKKKKEEKLSPASKKLNYVVTRGRRITPQGIRIYALFRHLAVHLVQLISQYIYLPLKVFHLPDHLVNLTHFDPSIIFAFTMSDISKISLGVIWELGYLSSLEAVSKSPLSKVLLKGNTLCTSLEDIPFRVHDLIIEDFHYCWLWDCHNLSGTAIPIKSWP